MSERDYRIHEREWEPLTAERIEDILDDTGADCPAGDYSAADVYALGREVVRLRAEGETVKRAIAEIERLRASNAALCSQLAAWRELCNTYRNDAAFGYGPESAEWRWKELTEGGQEP